jgi:dienelactone hydrolase
MMVKRMRALMLATAMVATPVLAQSPGPGEIRGAATAHTPASLAASVEQASVALPASVTGGAPFLGKWKDMPKTSGAKAPVVVFLHGSSGLGLKAIGEWQAWLANLGYASVAPDSFALPDRVTYGSPVPKDFYEKIHALRGSEIVPTLAALGGADWADMKRVALAGTSEGSPAVARYAGPEIAARMIFAWSCEDNYFVQAHATRVVADQPVLNVISTVDPFFSQKNKFLAAPDAKGHCGAAFAESKSATIVLIPGAPHTLLTLPQVKSATRAFLAEAFGR